MKELILTRLIAALLIAASGADGLGNPPDIEERLRTVEASAESGPFQPSWESLAEYRIPEWYQDAKFGIFIHWGLFSVPGELGPGYTARELYSPDRAKNGIEYPKSTFDPDSPFGFKDMIPMFKAERYDPAAWAKLFKRSGARYVVPVAEHHIGFAMYDSEYTEWNAAKMGPKRDLIADLEKSVREEGLHFGLSNHRAENWWYFGKASELPSDVQDDRYSGLYGPRANREASESGETPPDKAFLDDWMLRCCEQVDKYRPEIIWFDWWMVEPAFHPYLKTFTAYYYNQGSAWSDGVVVNYKKLGGPSYPDTAAVLDIERGGLAGIRELFWQTDTSVSKNSWHYARDPEYRTVDSLIDDLVDIVSKNGSLLLNIGPRPDGTIPEIEQAMLLEIGDWLRTNGEAIYETRPWTAFGEGPITVEDGTLSNKAERTRVNFTSEDIRFTRKGDEVYAIILDWPKRSGTVTIRSFTPSALPGGVGAVTMLGSDGALEWTQDSEGLAVKLPNAPPGSHAFAIKVSPKR